MTSLIAAGGSGRSTNLIPAVPAARSVTTMAFIWNTSLDQSSPAPPDARCLSLRAWHMTATAIRPTTSRQSKSAAAGMSRTLWRLRPGREADKRALEDAAMSHIKRFDHVGITVADLDAVTAFFVGLGLEVEGRTFVEGEFVDTVCGIPGSRTEIVMLRVPGAGGRLELSRFVRPDSVPGSPAAMANELGLRNVSFEVDSLQAALDWAASEGYGLVGGVGEYEGVVRMAYVRGPEGIVVSLFEYIG
jgi:catechol 2,3-dioxygenase-like lactoylglutathione lyase family enzyme